jgi:hypothetical protein
MDISDTALSFLRSSEPPEDCPIHHDVDSVTVIVIAENARSSPLLVERELSEVAPASVRVCLAVCAVIVPHRSQVGCVLASVAAQSTAPHHQDVFSIPIMRAMKVRRSGQHAIHGTAIAQNSPSGRIAVSWPFIFVPSAFFPNGQGGHFVVRWPDELDVTGFAISLNTLQSSNRAAGKTRQYLFQIRKPRGILREQNFSRFQKTSTGRCTRFLIVVGLDGNHWIGRGNFQFRKSNFDRSHGPRCKSPMASRSRLAR